MRRALDNLKVGNVKHLKLMQMTDLETQKLEAESLDVANGGVFWAQSTFMACMHGQASHTLLS